MPVSEQPRTAQGVCAVSLSSGPCLLALPCSATRGDLRIHDLAADGGDVVCEIAAHQQPLVRSASFQPWLSPNTSPRFYNSS
jgi:hypothetical protein